MRLKENEGRGREERRGEEEKRLEGGESEEERQKDCFEGWISGWKGKERRKRSEGGHKKI